MRAILSHKIYSFCFLTQGETLNLWKSKWRPCNTKIFKSIWEILYCIATYNIILFDTFLSCFCFYFITSLFPDSVLCLLPQKPALDLCCVVGLLPPLLILIMTTSGKFWDFVIIRVNSWLKLYFAGHNACSRPLYCSLNFYRFPLLVQPAFLWEQQA